MATYDVTEIDAIEQDASQGQYHSLVMIDSTHFILAYTGAFNDGFIKTFSIDSSYDNITEIDSLEHDVEQGTYNSLVMIDSTHFILAYAGYSNDGFIKVFSIDGSYDNITQLSSVEHDVGSGLYNSLVMIDSTHFMLAFTGGGSDGWIKTFSMDGSYNITTVDYLEHDSTQGIHNSLVMIDSTHFMLSYNHTGGYLKVFSIDGSYDNITQLTSLKQYDTGITYNSLVMIDSTHFMLSFNTDVLNGYVKTFSIDGSYNTTEIDSYMHDATLEYSSLIGIDSTHFMLAYSGYASDGFIKVFDIDGSYDTITQKSSLEHDTLQGRHNSLIKIDSTHFMLAYSGDGDDGHLKTFVYEAPAAAGGPKCRVFGGPFWGPLGGPI